VFVSFIRVGPKAGTELAMTTNAGLAYCALSRAAMPIAL
jgi:hypothetical protein